MWDFRALRYRNRSATIVRSKEELIYYHSNQDKSTEQNHCSVLQDVTRLTNTKEVVHLAAETTHTGDHIGLAWLHHHNEDEKNCCDQCDRNEKDFHTSAEW